MIRPFTLGRRHKANAVGGPTFVNPTFKSVNEYALRPLRPLPSPRR